MLITLAMDMKSHCWWWRWVWVGGCAHVTHIGTLRCIVCTFMPLVWDRHDFCKSSLKVVQIAQSRLYQSSWRQWTVILINAKKIWERRGSPGNNRHLVSLKCHRYVRSTVRLRAQIFWVSVFEYSHVCWQKEVEKLSKVLSNLCSTLARFYLMTQFCVIGSWECF